MSLLTGTVVSAARLADVSKTYPGAASPVLHHVSMDFPAKSMTAVMGPSGSGKSTLMHCAAGLDRPDSGRVLLGELDLTSCDEQALTSLRRHRIGFVFQQFNLLPMLTVYENVALPLQLAGRPPQRATVLEALDRVGLADVAGRRPAQLSGGQQQRVAVARTVATRPEVVFADEPTGSLDRATGRRIIALLRALVDEDGTTVVMVTHDPVAAAAADRVYYLVDGRVAETLAGPTVERITAWLTRWEG
ncbi:ABC transporter ATP-binding protein [Streptomyces spiroverticillatus]|uniref:ABC transporter ATP-binding protein n=1 Tax=Streptomyces finlayi TaxID=67296 RepID=A0A918X624_9ACTN|nr:ABC transporter ATP-binding protein [Streptomyces finlayi]GHA35255.1 ABC transporter ATP-binding protein [Streptomyces spiroverticillatus]GHD12985.1 ABC transporter ATP-binding protein [Streptomyces finlayi]